MAVPNRRLNDDVEADIDHHASTAWPQLDEVTIRWRGGYGYVTSHLTNNQDQDGQDQDGQDQDGQDQDGQDQDGQDLPLCRVGHLGSEDTWQFAIYDPSTDTYQDALLPNGQPAGTVQEALDCACNIHLADPRT
jgi:hypothetical protein